MRRLGPTQLEALALDAIEEAAAASHVAPVERTRSLALALAWLLHCSRPDQYLPRWPFESFWAGLGCEREHDRWSGVNAAVNAIYGALGVRRDLDRISCHEARVSRRIARTIAPRATQKANV